MSPLLSHYKTISTINDGYKTIDLIVNLFYNGSSYFQFFDLESMELMTNEWLYHDNARSTFFNLKF